MGGGIIFGLILGREVMYRCVSHSTLVTKPCGGVWRNGVRLGRSVWENAFHRHCNLLVMIVVMYLSSLLVIHVRLCVLYLYGWLFVLISLLGLHSLVDQVKLVICSMDLICLVSLDWVWLSNFHMS